MKKKLQIFLITFLIVFMVFPDTASAATTSRRMDEVLGEYAMSLVGKANDNMKAAEKYIGSKLIERFKDRSNELNDIFNGALSIGGDGLPETWDKIVDFVFPVEQQNVKITSTPALKAAIADIIVNMPENINIGSDYVYLGNFEQQKKYGEDLNIPFHYEYERGLTPSLLEFKFIVNTGQELRPGLSYASDTLVNTQGEFLRGFETRSVADNMYSLYVDMDLGSEKKEVNFLNMNVKLPLMPLHAYHTVNVDVYYSIGGLQPMTINKNQIISSSYLNKSSNDVYHVINGQLGDNTTVTYNFNQTYNNFDDFGLSPHENKVDSGDGIFAAILEFISSIPKVISDFLESLMGIVERIINIFIPTGEQIKGIGDSINGITDEFKGKFSFFIDLGDSLKSAFAKPSSIFDYQITLQGKNYPLIPSLLSGSLGQVRTFLSGALVLFTFTNIYKRIVGSGDVIKS